MQKNKSGIGNALAQGLRLSSNAAFEQDKAVEADRSTYRRKYWQGYTKRVKRIFGTVSREEYVAVQERANEAGRSVWRQVWAESVAYRSQTVLANCEIADQQRELVAEMRRIGNNINQLARLGHIQARKHGGLSSVNSDAIGTETIRQLEKLEAKVARFDDGMTIRVRVVYPRSVNFGKPGV